MRRESRLCFFVAKSPAGRAHCNQRLVIRTDPKNVQLPGSDTYALSWGLFGWSKNDCQDDYELAEGLRRKIEAWDSKVLEMRLLFPAQGRDRY